MGAHIPVYLADLFAVKALALLAVGIVVYLYWLGFQEKRAQRRDRQWLESRRRSIKAKESPKSEPPPGV
jgi:hypothetical protein